MRPALGNPNYYSIKCDFILTCPRSQLSAGTKSSGGVTKTDGEIKTPKPRDSKDKSPYIDPNSLIWRVLSTYTFDFNVFFS
jgi:hypothetical protein